MATNLTKTGRYVNRRSTPSSLGTVAGVQTTTGGGGSSSGTSWDLITGKPTWIGLATDVIATLPASTVVPNGGTIGQAAGPLLTFDDTNNYLEITGCNVGLGIAIPLAKLHSYNDTATTVNYLLIENATVGYNAGIQFKSTVAYWDIGTNISSGTGLDFYDRTNLLTRMTILQNGNIGIATSAPGSLFQINSPTTPYDGEVGAFSIRDTTVSVNKKLLFGIDTTLGTYGVGWIQAVHTGTSDLPLLLNAEGGNVAIGFTAPLSALCINGGLHVGGESAAGDNNLWVDGNAQEPSFNSGWQGTNWRIEAVGDAEFRNLLIRGGLSVYELIINQLHYQNGGLIIGAGAGKIKTVEVSTQGIEMVVFEDPEGNEIFPFSEGAIVMVQRVDINRSTVVKKLVRQVDSVCPESSASDLSVIFEATAGWVPAADDVGVFEEGDEVVAIGHISDTALDSSIYMSAIDSDNPFLRVFDGVNSYAKFTLGDKTCLKLQFGNLASIASWDVFGDASYVLPAAPGYGLFSNNVYLTGKIILPKAGMTDEEDSDNAIRIYAGETYDNRSSAPFRVTEDGDMVATSGVIGGWSISSAALYKDSGFDISSAGMCPDNYPFYAGKQFANRNTAPFRVTIAGAVYATSGEIGGWTLATDAFYTGVKYILDDWSASGITLANDGAFHSQNFYINSDGEVGIKLMLFSYTGVGDTLIQANDTEVTNASAVYIKVLGITLGASVKANRTIRIKFDLESSLAGSTVYGKIYNDTVAVGTERSTNLDTYTTYTEDIINWNAGDEIQLWVHGDGNVLHAPYVKNLRIYGEHAVIDYEVTATNTTP